MVVGLAGYVRAHAAGTVASCRRVGDGVAAPFRLRPGGDDAIGCDEPPPTLKRREPHPDPLGGGEPSRPLARFGGRGGKPRGEAQELDDRDAVLKALVCMQAPPKPTAHISAAGCTRIVPTVLEAPVEQIGRTLTPADIIRPIV